MSAIVFAIGLVDLAGWVFGVRGLVQWLSGQVAMVPNTALALILAAAALWLQNGPAKGRRLAISRVLAVGVMALALSNLAEYAFHASFGIDELLFRDPTGLSGTLPGRMSIITIVALLGVSAALLTARMRPAAWTADVLSLVPGVLGLTSLTAYAYGLRSMYWIGGYKAIAIQAAAAFLLLAIGVLLSRSPRGGFSDLIASRTAGGEVARRVIPVALVVPLALGWLGVRAVSSDRMPNGLEDAVTAVANAAVLLVVFVAIARQLRRSDERRVRSEETIRKLSRAVEQAANAIFITDADGAITYVNPAFERIYGFSRDEALGRTPRILNSGLHDAGFYEGFWARLLAGESVRAEFVNRRRSGELVTVEAVVSPLLDSEERRIGFVAVQDDITERKRAEASLQQSEERFRRTFAASPVGMTLSDPATGKIFDANERLARMLGYQREEMIGQTSLDLGIWVDPADRQRMIETLRASESLREFQTRLRTKSGEIRNILDSADLLRLGEQEVLLSVFHDVTELRLSEQRFSLAFRANPIPTSISEAETGRLLDVNEQFLKVLGYAREEVLGRTSTELGIWADPEQRARIGRRFARGESFLYSESTLRTKSGDVRRVVGSIVKIQLGSLPCALSTFIDVTEQKRAEERLMSSEERYRLLFEANPRPMWVFDTATLRFLAVNDAACRHYGYSRDEFLAMTIRDIRPPEDVSKLVETLRGEPREYRESGTWTHRRKSGEWIDVEIASHPFRFDGHDAQLVLATDVTERLRAEKEKRETEERYRALFEATPLPMWLYETPGLEIYDVNQAAVDVYGYSREEFRQLTLYDLRSPEEAEKLRRLFAENPDPLARWAPGVWEHRKRDGTPLLMDIYTHEVMVGGRRMRLAIQLDVTEHRRLEEQLRQSQKMEAVGRLAGGIAHDFNNILTTILGYSGLALEELRPGEPLHAELTDIQAAGIKAAELTRRLLAFSRRQILEPRLLDLNATMAGMERMLRRTIGEDVTLEFRPGPGIGTVRADAGQIEQVVMNLAINSRDAMPEGGNIVIETANADLDPEYTRGHADLLPPGRYVMLAVTDTGVGMDEATRARMFEPFFTTKEAGKGTGLGLSTVYGIVKQSGGYIWCYSEPGVGTSFKIYLPRYDARPEAAPAVRAAERLGGSETILLVEDEEALLKLGRTILSSQGYRVLTAGSAEEAKSIADRNPNFELLVTDVIMPGMSGSVLADDLQAARPGLKVLFMSGYTDDAIVRHGILQPGVAFLQKPFTPPALSRKVREILDRKP
jgi:two-component system cell cycle sensor histidine kinase/response regulator CckA